MCRVLSVGLGLALLVPAFAGAETLPPPARWVPRDAVAVLEVHQPKELLAFALAPKMLALVTSQPAYKAMTMRPDFQNFQKGVKFLEYRLGTDWKTGLNKLLGGGATAAILPGNGFLLIVDAADGELLTELHGVLVSFAGGEKGKKGGRLAPQTIHGVPVWSFDGKEAHAIVGSRLLLADRRATLEAALATRDGPESGSLAAVEAYRANRKALADDQAAGYVRWADLKKVPALKRLLDQGIAEPLPALLLAGVLDQLRSATTAGVGLRVKGETVSVEAVADGKPIDAAGPLAFAAPGKAGEGALPPFAVPRQVAAASLYRDLHRFYAGKDKLFPERTAGLIFFENMMGIFFTGRDLTDEIFAETAPELRLVVAGQEYDRDAAVPRVQIPAFALVIPLKHPREFHAVALEGWQKAVGLINLTRGQRAEAGMILDNDTHAGVKVHVAYFAPGKRDTKDRQDTRFNFRPALARVDRYLVLSSTDGLARDLVDALQKDAKESTKPIDGAHTLVQLSGTGLTAILQANRTALVGQNMVEKGNSKEQAEAEIDGLIGLTRLVKQARLAGTGEKTGLRLRLDLTLNLP